MWSKYQTKIAGVVLVAAFMLAGCDNATRSSPSAGPDREQRRQLLLDADAAFSALAFDEGLEAAYARFVAGDAVQLPDGGLPLQGKDAIMANVAAVVTDNDFALSWEALDAVVSETGDLGFTWGNYFLEVMDIDGEIYVADGKYLNVWQYSDVAGWQVIADMSNQNEPPYPDDLEFDFLPPEAGAE